MSTVIAMVPISPESFCDLFGILISIEKRGKAFWYCAFWDNIQSSEGIDSIQKLKSNGSSFGKIPVS